MKNLNIKKINWQKLDNRLAKVGQLSGKISDSIVKIKPFLCQNFVTFLSEFTILSWLILNFTFKSKVNTYAIIAPSVEDHSSFIFPGILKSRASLWFCTNHFALAAFHSPLISGLTSRSISSSSTKHIESVSKWPY